MQETTNFWEDQRWELRNRYLVLLLLDWALPFVCPSRVCRWFVDLWTVPSSSCLQIWVELTQGSCHISSILALFAGSSSNILPMMCLVSRGNKRSNRVGPFNSPSRPTAEGCGLFGLCSSSPSRPCPLGVRAVPSLDFDELPGRCWWVFEEERACVCCNSSGFEQNSLKDLSDSRGAFHGNRLSDMQQKMIARDQISAGCGTYLISLQTSGAKYGSDPTIPMQKV